MSSEEFWNELRKNGFTQKQIIDAGGRRRVILQSRDGDMPSVDHPDDFKPEQRAAILARFLRTFVI